MAQVASVQTLEKHIETYRALPITALTKHYLETPQDKQALHIIYNVVLAEKYVAQTDALNTQSTAHYQEAIQALDKLDNPALSIWVNTSCGFYYYTYSELAKAYNYFLKSSFQLKEVPSNNLLRPTEVYLRNAYFFGNINEPEMAISYLEEAKKITPKKSKTYAEILFSFGYHYALLNKTDLAEEYYTKAKCIAQEIGDDVRKAKALGELAIIAIEKKELTTAEELLLEDIKISKKEGDYRNSMYAQILLSELYLKQQKLEKAKQNIAEAEAYAKSKDYLKGFEKEIIEHKIQLAALEGDTLTELTNHRALDEIYKHLAVTDGEEVIVKINQNLQNQNFALQLAAKQAKLEKAKLLRITLIVFCSLLFIVCILAIILYNRKLKLQETTYQRNVLSFRLEKSASEKRLEETHKTLKSYKRYLQEKNEQVAKLEVQIEKIGKSSSKYLERKNKLLRQLLEEHLMTDENWYAFKEAFIKEQSDFYLNLKQQLPDLTESHLRIVILQKMELNNVEIANILGVTPAAVKKAKQRLRKKYNESYDALF